MEVFFFFKSPCQFEQDIAEDISTAYFIEDKIQCHLSRCMHTQSGHHYWHDGFRLKSQTYSGNNYITPCKTNPVWMVLVWLNNCVKCGVKQWLLFIRCIKSSWERRCAVWGQTEHLGPLPVPEKQAWVLLIMTKAMSSACSHHDEKD